jgi:MoaA/NifB/PqqE/SkfB family radical SAM enzyme
MAFRPFPLDGALLLFDRETGTNVLLDGEETAALRQVAPRSVLFGITNRCNLACAFCSRDLEAESGWTVRDAFDVLAELACRGALEVAFGGGEPFAFRGFEDLVARLYDETPLAIHATTNGLLVTRERLCTLAGKVGELRLSLYDNNEWRRTIALFVEEGVRFGVNLLALPERLPAIEALVLEILALGCRYILLLSYNGPDRGQHLSRAQAEDLADRVRILHLAVRSRGRIGLSVCWGDRMAPVPQFMNRQDCGAGRDFLVLTSDRRVMPCSFHDLSLPFRTAADILALWRERAGDLARPSTTAGCARLADYGLRGEA